MYDKRKLLDKIIILHKKILQLSKFISTDLIPIIIAKIQNIYYKIKTKHNIQIEKQFTQLTIKIEQIFNYIKCNKTTSFVYFIIIFTIWKIFTYSIYKIAHIKTTPNTTAIYDTHGTNITSAHKIINCYGFIESENNLTYQSQTNGIIKNFYVKDKQKINMGDPIATIESKETIEKYLSAKNFYESTLAKLNATKQLYKDGLESEISLKMLQAEFDNANSNFILVKKSYDGMNIKSPFDGVIDNIKKKAGSMINIGEPLFSIQKSNALIAKCNTSDKDIIKASTDDDVKLFLENDYHSNGKIAIISNNIDAYSGARNVTISNIEKIQDNQDLQPGQAIMIQIKIHNDHVFKVASDIVETNNSGGFMIKTYNTKEKKVICKNIQLFSEDDEGYFYITGLEDNDIIFQKGHENINCKQTDINIKK